MYSILQTRLLRLRALNLVASISLLVFNALIEVWPMVAMNATLAAINSVKIVQLPRQRHDEAVFEVIEVGPDEPVPPAHPGQPPRRHRPVPAGASTGSPRRAGSHAFVVVKRDETVGVVLLRAEGDVAHVQLDYVTPRYRDFSPGEFVWRRSGVLRERGLPTGA